MQKKMKVKIQGEIEVICTPRGGCTQAPAHRAECDICCAWKRSRCIAVEHGR